MNDKKWTRQKTHAELYEELGFQADLLRTSATAYDAGQWHQAAHMATIAATLFHDGMHKKSKSLLGTLGLKGRFLMIDTSIEDQELKLCYYHHKPLEGRHRPHCAINPPPPFMFPRPIAFKEWWDMKIFETGDDVGLTREELILELRHRHGGAHVDANETNMAYHILANQIDIVVRDGEKRFDKGPHWASMRQIAWEIDKSLASIGV